MPSIRTGNNRARRPRTVCKRDGHIPAYGYGLAFGGGPGAYSFCGRCMKLFVKSFDDDDS